MNRLVQLSHDKYAHASGALWLPAVSTALLADVHLGYGWAQRRRGQLGPVTDGGVRVKLQRLIEELRPKCIVFLGDLVHAPRPSPQERAFVEETLQALQLEVELVIVRGNHDRGFALDYQALALTVRPSWETADLFAVHGDLAIPPTHKTVAVGHYHPALGMRDAAGVRQRVPMFLAAERTIVLPAFSPFAAGFDITKGLTPMLRQLFGKQEIEGIAATGKRVVRVGPIHRLPAVF